MPTTTAIRTAKRLMLGNELRYLRIRAGLNQAEAAKILEKAQSKITALEAGQATITLGDLLLLAKGLGVEDQRHLDLLAELRRDNHKRGYWSTGYFRAYHDDFRLMVDLENHADRIRTTESEVMPGLLQCESYVRALFSGRTNLSERSGVTFEQLVESRLARQKILHKDTAPQYHVVMSESCLRREFGGPDVMREQIQHVIEMSRLPHVIVQVLPFKTTPKGQSSILSRYIVIRVPSPGVAGPLEVAYTENEADIRYLDEPAALEAHDNSWARLTAVALSPDDSRSMLQRIRDEYLVTHKEKT